MSALSQPVAHARLTPNLFASAFGLGGLAECWTVAHNQGAVPGWPADGLWLTCALVWLVTLVAYLRYLAASGRLRTDLQDPTFGPFVPLASIVPMLLGSALATHARTAGSVVFVAGAVATVLLGGWLSGQWILAENTLDHWHPGYFLPTVAGGFLASAGFAQIGHHDLAVFMFGYAAVCWIALGSIILLRLFTRPRLPAPLLPTMAIEVAPPVVAGAAWFAVNGGRADAVALGLAGYALLMVLVQVRLSPAYWSLAFGPGWWAFCFSYCAAFTVAIRWLAVGHAADAQAWARVLLAVITAGVAALAGRTAFALVRRTYLTRPVPAS